MRTDKAAPELVLKATAPRVAKGLLLRQELRMDAPRYADKAVVAVQAPAGCGKTALLGQWRRESLMRAADVAWLTLDERDEPVRFVQGVLAAMRLGNARGKLSEGLGGGLLDEEDALDALTSLLAAIASQPGEIVLFLDDVHRLPPASLRRPLPYLLLNAPPNLRLVFASRLRLALPVSDRLARGEYAEIGAQELHFRLEESMALLHARLGEAVDADAGALLHERTEGWPLGLQLAISTIQKSEDPGEAIRTMSGGGGDLQTWFVESLFARLPPEQAAFLVRICLVQAVTPALCVEITGDAQAATLLLQLCESTPIFADASGGEWLRFHPLARDFLLPLFEELPEAERRQLCERASAWLAGEQLFEEAAQLALDAGHAQLAYDLAERCMYELNLAGQVGRVLEWLERLPESEVMRRPRLRIAAAWALALGGQHERARALVAHIYADPGADVEDRCESAAVCSAAAIFADRLDEAEALVADWARLVPPESIPLQLFLAIQQAQFCLYRGDPEQARFLFLNAPHDGGIPGMESNRSYGDWLVGTSYLAEGQVLLAEGVLRTALAHAEKRVGRRSQVGVTLATALASSLWERDQPEAVAALLANRLDAIERLALPEIVASAFSLRARWLALHDQEHRAFDLLGSLHSLGERRRMPRLCLVSLGEQVRMHALRNRRETCASLFARLQRAVPESFRTGEGLLGMQCRLLHGIAEAYHLLAAGEHEAMLAVLDRLVPVAEGLRRGGDSIRIQLLRALAIDRGGGDGRSLFLEAHGLAETYGLARVVVDTHPDLAEWAPAPAIAAQRMDTPAPPRHGPPRVAASALLTAKEGEILSLLAGNLSNKQIARTLDVREDTIKWHLKNLFGKLHVSSRRQAVQQARLVGLLDDGL